MSRVFTDEQVQFVRDRHTGLRIDALTNLVNEHFGTAYTRGQIANLKKRQGLISNYVGPRYDGHNFLFTPDQRKFFDENQYGLTAYQVAVLMNETFGTSFTQDQIRAYRKNHHIHGGLDTRFKKGRVSPNKGKKIPRCSEAAMRTWFKKGHKPHNHLPVGSEVMATIGYIVVKVAEPNVWRLKHRMIWEEVHGRPVPEGYRVVFLDGDRLNFSPDNLLCVSMDAVPALRKKEVVGVDDVELRKAALITAEVKARIKNIEQKNKEE